MSEIIAELCQNHNGDLKILEEMVHAASESGADFAKIQSLHSSELTHRERFDNGINELSLEDFMYMLSRSLGVILNESSACKITLYVNPSDENVVIVLEANNVSIVEEISSALIPKSYALSLSILRSSLGLVNL